MSKVTSEPVLDFPFREGEVRAAEVGPDVWVVVVEPAGGHPLRYRLVGPDAGRLARGLAALPRLLGRPPASEAERVTVTPWQGAEWLSPELREVEEELLAVAEVAAG